MNAPPRDDLISMLAHGESTRNMSPEEFLGLDRPARRTPPSVVGFGIHRCVGNRLAELQLKILWEEILKRFPEINVIEEPKRVPNSFIHGYAEMQVVIPRRI